MTFRHPTPLGELWRTTLHGSLWRKNNSPPFILGGVAVAFVLAVVVFALTFDITSYRHSIEAAASGATGLEVRINGKMGLSFFPLGASARDIHVANMGGEILSLENLRLGAELIPLLKRQLKVTSCELVKPAVTVVKDAEGKYNFEGTERKLTEMRPGAASSLNELKLSKGVLVYLDKKTGEQTEFKAFSLAIPVRCQLPAPRYYAIKNRPSVFERFCKVDCVRLFAVKHCVASFDHFLPPFMSRDSMPSTALKRCSDASPSRVNCIVSEKNVNFLGVKNLFFEKGELFRDYWGGRGLPKIR